MSYNPRVPKDEDQGTDWSALALPRIYPNSADPRMEVKPPADESYIPNWGTTPTPPDVWMASAPQDDRLAQLLRALQILQART